MSTEKNDFEFVSDLASDFFGKKSIKDTMLTIKEFEMSGWEKWLQIEFAKFCKDQNSVSSWWREQPYDLDKRISKMRKTCSVDFLIREKHKQSFMALELKQINSPTACIGAMIMDVKKINKIKVSADDIRSIWCLGIHHETDAAEIKRKVSYYGDKHDVEINKNHVKTNKISKTGYSFTLF